MLLIASGIDCDPLPESDSEDIHVYRSGEKITTLTEENIRSVAAQGATAMQIPASDIYNRDLQPNGRADWSLLDNHMEMLAAHKMQAFIVAGFHLIPPCLKDHRLIEPLRCLSHNKTIPFLSLWSDFTCEWVETCVAALADHMQIHLDKSFVIHANIYGDYGETMYPADGFHVIPDLADHIREEPIHNHRDFWCNDKLARKDFQRVMQEKGRSFNPDLDDANFYPSAPAKGEFKRDWICFLEWYHESMTRYVSRITSIFQTCFPDRKRIFFQGGGREPHVYGQDNTALPKVARATNTMVRSTASGSEAFRWQTRNDPETLALAFQRNYPIVKRIATACKFYDVPFMLEAPYPPGLKAPGVVARIFEAVSCGAAGYFDWTRTLQREDKTYRQYLDLLQIEKPPVDIAVYFPILSHRCDIDSELPDLYLNGAAAIRTIVDYDVIDDHLIMDGILDRYRMVVFPQLEYLEADVFDRISAWVQKGGLAITRDCGPIACTDTIDEDSRPLFGNTLSERDKVGKRNSDSSGLQQGCGKGAVVFSDGSEESLVPAVCESIQQSPLMKDSASQLVVEFSQPGQVFVTVLKNHLLLANLCPEPFKGSLGNCEVEMNPYSITKIKKVHRSEVCL